MNFQANYLTTFINLLRQQSLRQMTTTWSTVEQFFKESGIKCSLRGLTYLCQIEGRQFYYSPNTGKWRIKGKRVWKFSDNPQDFLNQARNYSPPNYQRNPHRESESKTDQNHRGGQKKRNQTSKQKKRNNTSKQRKDSRSHNTHKNFNSHNFTEIRPEFLSAFGQALSQQRQRGYKIGWIWYAIEKKLVPTPGEICWLSVVFDYSIGWAFHHIKDLYGYADYSAIASVIQTYRTTWLHYFNTRWEADNTHRSQREQQRQQTKSSHSSKRTFPYQNYLDALNISFPVTPEELKSAYRKRAKETHPDLGGTAEAFRQVNTAYEVLVNVI